MRLSHTLKRFPRTQGELLRSVRSDRTQAEFARVLGVERSCLSRYESEALGAPASVITYCLAALARTLESKAGQTWPIDEALGHAREAVAALERLNTAPQSPPTRKTHNKRTLK